MYICMNLRCFKTQDIMSKTMEQFVNPSILVSIIGKSLCFNGCKKQLLCD